jgi:hypothetical protein
MKVHHNTAKKAKTHHIDLTVEDGEFVATHKTIRLASGMLANVVLQQAIDKLADLPTGVKLVHPRGTKTVKASKAPKEVSIYEGAQGSLDL